MRVTDLRQRVRRSAAWPPCRWGWRSRLLIGLAALVATAPVWPVIQPGEPVADELLAPGEVAVIVPVVLILPLAWALIGRSRQVGRVVGLALVGCVAAWSVGTARFAGYATPPTVDDGLRSYLVAAGCLVAIGVAVEVGWHRTSRAPLPAPGWRRTAGLVAWVVGVGATAAVPVLDGEPMPPRDAFLPLPPAVVLLGEEAACAAPGRSCVRRFTVAATDGANARDLTRRLGRHLAETRGWAVTRYDFAPEPVIACRPVAGLANPYRLCAQLRVDERDSTVEVWFAHSNPHDPVY